MNGLRGIFQAKKMADLDLVVKKSYFPTKVYLVGVLVGPQYMVGDG
jgi:hypothetical protein